MVFELVHEYRKGRMIHQQSVHELESLYTSHSVHSPPSTGVYALGNLYGASYFISPCQLS